MGWYTVTKRINGHYYLYLQMTYRENGKVKTKNKYLGPVRGGTFGFGAPANLPTAENRTVTTTPKKRTKREKDPYAYTNLRKTAQKAHNKYSRLKKKVRWYNVFTKRGREITDQFEGVKQEIEWHDKKFYQLNKRPRLKRAK